MDLPMPAIRPQPGIMEITPYVGGESRIPGVERVIKLSSNENPWGPSPKAIAAFRAAADRLALYPDASHRALREAIAEVHGLDPARIVCGAGSDELIAFLCTAFAGPGDEVIHTRHGFAMYRISALVAGARPVEVPERERRIDPDAILAACTPRTRLVFLANPGNPTGTLLAPDQLARLAAALPAQALLVLDGAYAEYVTAPGHDAGRALAAERPNVVMLRTFSKIHGLAALRVGWGYGPAAVMAVLERVRGPFNLSIPALEAAEAAMRDRDWPAACAARNAALRTELRARLAAAGVPADASEANFVLARFDSPATAAAADAHLRARGLIVRRVAGYGFPAALRISIGTEEATGLVAEAVADFMAGR